jgi:hypothetical protein
MGKSTISMAIFQFAVLNYQRLTLAAEAVGISCAGRLKMVSSLMTDLWSAETAETGTARVMCVYLLHCHFASSSSTCHQVYMLFGKW